VGGIKLRVSHKIFAEFYGTGIGKYLWAFSRSERQLITRDNQRSGEAHEVDLKELSSETRKGGETYG
jgi:hypothetical protein